MIATSPIRQRTCGGRNELFDPIRRRWVAMTEEEKVRQWLLLRLINEKQVPPSHLSVERAITVNGMTKRYDVVVYDATGSPAAVIECKAPTVALTQRVVEQVANYNRTLKAPIIGVCNGKEQLFFKIHFETGEVIFLPDFVL